MELRIVICMLQYIPQRLKVTTFILCWENLRSDGFCYAFYFFWGKREKGGGGAHGGWLFAC